jgi:hypothetical protein
VAVQARLLAALALALALAAESAPVNSLGTLGTLFTTAQERERLERLRRGEPELHAVPEAAGRAQSTITGFVRRSDGRNTVWIDGSPVRVARPGAGALLEPGIVGTPPDDETLHIERKPAR